MNIEIERKFLVKSTEWNKLLKGKEYKQGYLFIDKDYIIRVRMESEKGTLTIKTQAEGQSRLEFSYEIPPKEALILLQSVCKQPLIYKTRYLIPQGTLYWEVDVFHKENQGLILAEIELQYSGQPFHKPDWIGREVTSDARYYNANLVHHPYQNWK